MKNILLKIVLISFLSNIVIASEKPVENNILWVSESDKKETLPTNVSKIEDSLDAFIDVYLKENLELRSKNAKNIYKKALELPETDLLFNSIYKTLGYENRNNSVAFPPELSSYGYKDNQELFTFGLIASLENTYALLDSTLQRMKYTNDDWIEPTIRKNLILNAIHIWYRNNYNVEYSQILDGLSKDSLIKLKEISKNRFNLEKKLWNQTQIALFGLRADSSALSQYFLLENSKIYLNTGFKKLPNNSELWDLQFGQKKFCQSDAQKLEQGFDFLVRSFPIEMEQIKSSELNNKKAIWSITKVSQKLAKRALVFPNKTHVQNAVYALTDLVIEKMLLLNQRRLNKFLTKTDDFFASKKPAFKFRNIDAMQTSLHEIYELILVDYFLASERAAFASLLFHRKCGLNASTIKSDMKFSKIMNNQYTENLNIKGFEIFTQKRIQQNTDLSSFFEKNFMNRVTMAKVVDLFMSPETEKNNSIETAIQSAINLDSSLEKNISATTIENEDETKLINKLAERVSTSDFEKNIRYADFFAASAVLKKRNIHLLNSKEVNQIFKGSGYTTQVVSTTSPDDVVYTFRKYRGRNDVFVYLSKVTIDNERISIFKILVGARKAENVSRKDYLELLDSAKQRNAFLKPYSFVRADVVGKS